MSSDDWVIRVENVSKCYQIYERPEDRLRQALVPRLHRLLGMPLRTYAKEFWALREISLEVRKGESVAIIGRNGSGKSTLLQIICGTLSPTAGEVRVKGRVAALLELGSGFNPDFSGRENVYLNGAILGLSREEIDMRFDEIAAFADIGDFINQPVKTYSSGMMVRLAFAVSVCVDPDVLVVDEALSVGDTAFQFKCLDRLQRLAERGTSLLFVSHDMGMVKNFCDHALYLTGGVERARGAPQDMAELYYMDMRDEQRRSVSVSAGAASGVFAKTPLGTERGLAFGTDEGHVVSALFPISGGSFSSYMHGDLVELDVKVRCLALVEFPAISFIVQNQKLMEVGGAYFLLTRGIVEDGWMNLGLRAKFAANLAVGRYFVTVRLENRPSDKVWEPLDKQVAAMSFEVLDSSRKFLGVVDLGFEMAQG